MNTYEHGRLGGVYISSTSERTAEAGYKFVAIQALTDVNIASTGEVNLSGLGSSSQSLPLPANSVLRGTHTVIRLTTGGSAVAYYGYI